MNEFVEVKTSELAGAALDWAVAVADGLKIRQTPDFIAVGDAYGYIWRGGGAHADYSFHPSTNWSQGGPLIDKFGVWLSDDECENVASTHPHVNEYIRTGPTKLIASCRAIVAAKLGDVVMIPKKLMAED